MEQQLPSKQPFASTYPRTELITVNVSTLVLTIGMGFGFGFGQGMGGGMHSPFKNESAAKGSELFSKKWESTDPEEGNGDGLGPLFNANSCATCHPGGGASGTENNVQLLTEKKSENAPLTKVLHRFGTDPNYERWRLKKLGLKGDSASEARNKRMERYRFRKYEARPPVFTISAKKDHQVRLSERNTPALFGAALIDSVTLEDLQAVEELQEKQEDGISGRVPMVTNGRPGRFGWRGQIATLRDFVLGACANELGLQFRDNKQAADPLNPLYELQESDMTFEQTQNLIDFIAGLEAPGRLAPVDDREKHLLSRGEHLMDQVHCSRCHRKTIGNVTGVYSDLLLHDMGKELADPVPAKPALPNVTFSSSGSGYFGTFDVESIEMVETNIHQEWRTPPLWGIADTAPYLHDGRAATLEDAIGFHGGEAEQSRKMFERLPKIDQRALIAFLKSLSVGSHFQPVSRVAQ